MSALAPGQADRLAKVLGLLGSDHDGERAAAALMATKIIRAAGLTWPDIVTPRPSAPPPPPPPKTWREPHTPQEAAAECLRWSDVLTDWEKEFCKSVMNFGKPTNRQITVLAKVTAKAKAFAQRSY